VDRTRRRRQILDAAAKVFSARGYHDTSVSHIIEEAGIARGTFYLYFESKRAVFGELIDKFLVEVQSCVRRVSLDAGSPPPYEQLHGNFSRILALLLEERDMSVIVLNHAVGLDGESDQKLGEFYDGMAGALERALRTGQQLGLVSVDDVQIAARLILGGIKEVVHRLVVQESEPREHDRLVEEFLRVFLCGVIEGKLHVLLKPNGGRD
jgi:AcrR family transcriptional regulator